MQRIGQLAATARHFAGRADKAIHTTARIYHAVKEHIPESKIKSAAERGLSDYEAVREKIRAAGMG